MCCIASAMDLEVLLLVFFAKKGQFLGCDGYINVVWVVLQFPVMLNFHHWRLQGHIHPSKTPFYSWEKDTGFCSSSHFCSCLFLATLGIQVVPFNKPLPPQPSGLILYLSSVNNNTWHVHRCKEVTSQRRKDERKGNIRAILLTRVFSFFLSVWSHCSLNSTI